MNIGIVIDCCSVLLGGLIGSVIKDHLSDSFKTQLTKVLGLSSMGMGVAAIVLMEHMPAVIFALIIGTSIGLIIHLGKLINSGAVMINNLVSKSETDTDRSEMMVTAVVLFCASGTGIYGALTAGMSGDSSILIAKSMLDLFTAMIFACTLGRSVSLIAIPQFIILEALYLLAGVIVPLTTPSMINDFKACGGFIMLATGFRMVKLLDFPIADMLPAMILVMPFSALWTSIF
ncbi:DUF554 domain-containing protein [Galactobacillus timonensis]|uniref:DUF554 domain-containing protein n=1 Tax=Galactobacillus timonensis TaxID=2041840 RepID=UPI000C855EE9|nr:DUF554 domain-containing protein [Galactobacillus timonensis]